jgi:hypothetical protein
MPGSIGDDPGTRSPGPEGPSDQGVETDIPFDIPLSSVIDGKEGSPEQEWEIEEPQPDHGIMNHREASDNHTHHRNAVPRLLSQAQV